MCTLRSRHALLRMVPRSKTRECFLSGPAVRTPRGEVYWKHLWLSPRGWSLWHSYKVLRIKKKSWGCYKVANLTGAPIHQPDMLERSNTPIRYTWKIHPSIRYTWKIQYQSDMLERSFLMFTLACFIEDSGHGLPSASIAAPPMSAYISISININKK